MRAIFMILAALMCGCAGTKPGGLIGQVQPVTDRLAAKAGIPPEVVAEARKALYGDRLVPDGYRVFWPVIDRRTGLEIDPSNYVPGVPRLVQIGGVTLPPVTAESLLPSSQGVAGPPSPAATTPAAPPASDWLSAEAGATTTNASPNALPPGAEKWGIPEWEAYYKAHPEARPK